MYVAMNHFTIAAGRGGEFEARWRDRESWLEEVPGVVQFHLAGHTNNGTHIIDTHDDYVIDEVWELYRHAIGLTGPVSTLLEWDANIPSFDIVHAEALKAKAYRGPKTTAETEVRHAG